MKYAVITFGCRVNQADSLGVEATLTAAGARVYSSRERGEWSGIVSFEWPGADPRRVKPFCVQRQVMISTRDGRLRASPHFYNNEADLDALLSALTAYREQEEIARHQCRATSQLPSPAHR